MGFLNACILSQTRNGSKLAELGEKEIPEEIPLSKCFLNFASRVIEENKLNF